MISKTNQLELRPLRYFLVLAETLHYRKAADILFISQSALSQQIKQLEAILGVTLFERTNRKVALSRPGQLLVKEAELILKQLGDSMERWQLTQDGVMGQLKIGFVGSAMQMYLPLILKEFGKKYTKINFYLEELTNTEQIRALEHEQLDIGFMRSNIVSPDLRIKSVYKENFSLVLPENHYITKDNFKHMGQLSEESFILFPNENSPMYFQQIQNLCADQGFSPRISHKSIHGPTIFKLVENGMGISIVPNSLRDEHNYKIKFLELDNVPHRTELFAAWKKTNTNPALHYFLELI
ncbi:LysR family transcriptional regulator [Arenibacter sp. M-2]|uniref:LysR family transcriptional regulator n=1 Tax=Arenibacter sp. M-2 TaxID=3053612 RepID=UPI00256FF723|nr:LysR family transcriptional regulator [Arenibacter sp. M-2]MDL5512276.1 LysR family transcriptional regulator [Arenibacter sp. M-2]|tara:strand:- start:1480 stop:2367 length:888 start_codon:yes stop_codon:yes gene_type:complete